MNVVYKNIFYFPNLVDVRTAAKCGSANFKELYRHGKLHWKKEGQENNLPLQFHGPLHVRLMGNVVDVPFRKGSTRFAIKRDPVKRFLSAVDYIEQSMLEFRPNTRDIKNPDMQIRKNKHLKNPKHYPIKGFRSLEDAITAMEANRLYDVHFFSQTSYYGNINQYDYVYDLVDFSKAMSHITSLIGDENLPNRDVWSHSHKNKSKKKLSLELTDELAERIKTLYQIDYDNGWC